VANVPELSWNAYSRITPMPYYSQGDSYYCWSVALTMLMAGYAGLDIEPWHPGSHFGIAQEDGYSLFSMAYGPGLKAYLQGQVPGRTVERHVWFSGYEATGLKVFLLNNMIAGKPTMLFLKNPGEHMILLVGYDMNTAEFVVHNPNSNPYERWSWETILDGLEEGGLNQTMTLNFTEGLSEDHADYRASLTIPFATARGGSVDAMVRDEVAGKFLLGTARIFSWYVDADETFGLVNLASGTIEALTLDHRLWVILGAAGLTPPGSSAVSELFEVFFRILDANEAVLYTAPAKLVKLKPGDFKDGIRVIPEKAGRPLREMVPGKGAYIFEAVVAQGGEDQDTARFPFDVKGDEIVYRGTWSGEVGGSEFHGEEAELSFSHSTGGYDLVDFDAGISSGSGYLGFGMGWLGDDDVLPGEEYVREPIDGPFNCYKGDHTLFMGYDGSMTVTFSDDAAVSGCTMHYYIIGKNGGVTCELEGTFIGTRVE